MSDAVKVLVRFRPRREGEEEKESGDVWSHTSAESLKIYRPSRDPNETVKHEDTFTFDRVFGSDTTQEQLYDESVSHYIDDVLDGFNCTILAYGQTGSGKTHSLMGPVDHWSRPEEQGAIPRLVYGLFSKIREQKDQVFIITVSYIEIYMEEIHDLLGSTTRPYGKGNLKIRERQRTLRQKKHKNKKHKNKSYIYIEGCTTFKVNNEEELFKIMRRGESHRTTAATKMNDRSSRSHAVFMMDITQMDVKRGTRKSSKLYLVDLAGSEYVDQSGVTGQQLQEAMKINRSLTELARVIRCLTEEVPKGHKRHIPYRNSKLTRLLQESIGGNAKTTILLTCSPREASLRQTYSTLAFGQRAKSIKNAPIVNHEMSIAAYKTLVDVLKGKLQTTQDQYVRALALLKLHNIDLTDDQGELSEVLFEIEKLMDPNVDRVVVREVLGLELNPDMDLNLNDEDGGPVATSPMLVETGTMTQILPKNSSGLTPPVGQRPGGLNLTEGDDVPPDYPPPSPPVEEEVTVLNTDQGGGIESVIASSKRCSSPDMDRIVALIEDLRDQCFVVERVVL